MLMFRGILVSLLLPVWAGFGLAAIAFASQAEAPVSEDQLGIIGIGNGNVEALETAAIAVLVAGLAVHVLAAVVTSRAVAAMAGSIGGFIGVAIAAVAAVGLAVAPSGDRVDVLTQLVRPVGIATIAVISLVLGFRAFLAHTGRWGYRNWQADHHAWDDGGGWGDD